MDTTRSRVIFITLVGLLAAAALSATQEIVPQGMDLQRAAWLASYPEDAPGRHLEPREGWNGFAMRGECPDEENCTTRWPDGTVRVEVEGGLQHERGCDDHDDSGLGARCPLVLVLGESVAWGAYASDQAHTWWALVAQRARVRVVVRGRQGRMAWDEVQEARRLVAELAPDLVVALDGPNDLTQRNGTPLPRAARRYVESIEALRKTVEPATRLLVVYQPTPTGRPKPSLLEKRVFKLSLRQLMGHTMAELRAAEDIQIVAVDLDLRDAFASLPGTVFVDWWHFADPAHDVLAETLVEPILARLARPI